MRSSLAVASRPPDELDELTLRRAQRGDEAACRELVLRYQRPVYAVISRIVGRGPAVDDLAQETFLRTFRALAGFDRSGPARLSTWIVTIATRLCLDHLRRRRAPGEPLDAHVETLRAPDRTDAGARRPELLRAIEALEPDQRAALVLRELQGMSTEEVAEALGIEAGTVKSRLSRAKAALRAALEDDDV